MAMRVHFSSSNTDVNLKDTILSTVSAQGTTTAQFKCIWIISEYEKVKNSLELNQYIESTDSFSVFSDSVIFRFKLWPKGTIMPSGLSKNTDSLFLINVGSAEKVWMKIKFELLNEKGIGNNSKCSKITPLGRVGFDNYFPFNFSSRRYPSLLPNGCLRILCTGTVWTNEPKLKEDVADQVFNNSCVLSVPELFCTELKPKFDSKVYLGGGNYFEVNRAFLCAQSSVFEWKFQTATNEGSNTIKVSNITVEEFREIIYFFHTNTVTFMIDTMLPKALKFAHEYKLDYLQEICETKMMEKLSIENAVDYYRVAREINAVELKDIFMDFILSNGTEITKQESFEKLKFGIPELGELLERVFINNAGSVVTM